MRMERRRRLIDLEWWGLRCGLGASAAVEGLNIRES
jgi:hypothetical protein